MLETNGESFIFSSISEHLYNLKDCIQYSVFDGDFINDVDTNINSISESIDWLELAADIVSVEIKPQYSSSSLWCSSAYEYEKEHKSYRKIYAFKISRLVFTWSAFERFCAALKISSIISGREGIGVKAGKYLESRDLSFHPSFVKVWEKFSKMYLVHEDYGRSKKEIYPYAENWSAASLINLARDVRNKAAHGASSLKSPEDYSFGKPLSSNCYLCFIDLAVRSILLTMQILISTNLSNKNNFYSCSNEDTDKVVDLESYLNILHLADVKRPSIMYY